MSTATADPNVEHLRKIATPTRVGLTVSRDAWSEDYIVDPWILLCEAEFLEAFLDTEQRFKRFHLPPQVGKTRFATLAMFWALGTNPDTRIIFVTYSDDYSRERGREVRNLVTAFGKVLFGIEVDPDKNAAGDWGIKGRRGGMLSVGVGSQITGRSGDLIWVDDLIKNAQDAASVAVKKLHIREFDGTIRPRLQPGGTLILSNTRWAEDDLAGEIDSRVSAAGYRGDQWEILAFPAVAEIPDHDDVELTPEERAEWRDILGRLEGEPLTCRYYHVDDPHDPANWETSIYYRLRASGMDDFTWSSVYQQSPSSRVGGMFPKDKWRRFRLGEQPQFSAAVRVWDLAASEGGGDWTTGSRVEKGPDQLTRVTDVIRVQLAPDKVLELVKATAVADGHGVGIVIEEERSGSGKTVVAFYERELLGHHVRGARAEGTKEVRATPYSTLQQAGRILIPHNEDAPWVRGFVAEHAQMMGDGRRPKHDDQIDTVAYAVLELMASGGVEILDASDANVDAEDEMLDLLLKHTLGIG